ncbi:MAG: YceI family protein [Bacteroidia bacterium]|nr:YceI family protein [Bacteroidia bacterium]
MNGYQHFFKKQRIPVPGIRWIALVIGLISINPVFSQDMIACRDGYVRWTSEAPLELIQAESDNLQGIIRLSDRTFAFNISVRSFDGFNSPLQREHFHENYLETESFSKATFTGKILDPVDFNQPGIREVRVKGDLMIHGVTQERIIRAVIEVLAGGEFRISAEFSVMLADHEISIPRIVFQKIAEEIQISVKATMLSTAP